MLAFTGNSGAGLPHWEAPALLLPINILKISLRSTTCFFVLLALLITASLFLLLKSPRDTDPIQVHPGQAISEATVPGAKLESASTLDPSRASPEIAPKFTPGIRELASDGTDLVVVGRESMMGRVVDEAGQPIDGFRLLGSFRSSLASKWEERDLGIHSGGNFLLTNLRKGKWRITATHIDFMPTKTKRLRLPQKGEPLVITLRRGATLSGTIIDPAGFGQANAEVVIKTGSKVSNHSGSDVGEFRVTIEPGPFICIARGSGFAASEEVRGELRAGEERRIELALTAGGRLVGIVQDLKGQVLPGYSIYLNGMDWKSTDREVLADELGRFAFENLPPGTYWAGAHKNPGIGKAYKPIRKVVEVNEGETTEFILGGLNREVVTLSGTLFVGQVPAPNFRVWGGLNDSKTFAEGYAVSTDEQGRYELRFSGPGAGQFLVIFGKQQFALVPVEVGEGPLQEFDIHAPSGSLSGRVLEGGEPPKRKAFVRCIPEGFAPAMSRSLTRSSSCEKDGSFRFENLTPGVYRLEVKGYKNRGAVAQDIHVGLDSQVTHIELETGGKGFITVRVLGSEGNLTDGAYVYAVDQDGMVHNHPLTGVATNTSGQVKLRRLGLGSYRFFAQTKTMVSKSSASILIDEGKEQVLTLQMSLGGRLEFQYPEGLHAKQARIWVIGSQGIDYSSTLLTLDSASYLAEGELDARESIGPLPPGKYTVRIQDFGGGMLEGTATVRAGTTHRVELKPIRR